MKIITFENGPISVNSYLVTHESTTLIIDPGAEILDLELPDPIKGPEALLVTHAHIDHVDGINLLKEKYPLTQVMMSEESVPLLGHIAVQAKMFGMKDPGKIIADQLLTPNQPVTIGSITIMPIATPGHCPGSLSFLIGENLFTGDALFRGTIGRTDIPGGDAAQLIESIRERLLILPDETKVYPGHSDSTTIGHEKKANPWLRVR